MPYLDVSWLDDARHLERCDSRDSLRALATAGAQVREAMTLAREKFVMRPSLTSEDVPVLTQTTRPPPRADRGRHARRSPRWSRSCVTCRDTFGSRPWPSAR